MTLYIAPKRKRAAAKKAKTGGVRKGAGRPTLFPGKKAKITVKLTNEVVRTVNREEKAMEKRSGFASFSMAVERLLRLQAGLPVDNVEA